MADGLTASKSLKNRGFSKSAYWNALERTPQLLTTHALAESALAEALAAEAIEISDEFDDPQRARNRIDVRKWYASRIKPSKFGDRLDVNVTQIVDIGAALQEARARLRPVGDLNREQPIKTAVIEANYECQATGAAPANLIQAIENIDPFENSEETLIDNSDIDIFS